MSLLYDYPRNRILQQKLLDAYKKNFGINWEPQGSNEPKMYGGSAKSLINVNGQDYYQPASVFDVAYLNNNDLNAFNKGQLKFKQLNVRRRKIPQPKNRNDFGMGNQNIGAGKKLDAIKKVAKPLISFGLDRIPEATGTLASMGVSALGQPELAPFAGFLGKELGKKGRQLIKEKTGYGKRGRKANEKFIGQYMDGMDNLDIEVMRRPAKIPVKRPAKKKPVGGSKCGGRGNSTWIERVKRYQQENGISYKQALIELSKKNKK